MSDRIRRQAVQPMPTVYKYLPREYAEALVHKGRLRLGTLHDFQDEELHGSTIGDNQEGVKHIYDAPGLFIAGTGAKMSPLMKAAVGGSVPDGTIFDRCSFTASQRTPNRWLYCTSRSLDERLYKEFKADTCITITDARSFYRSIFDHLVDRRLGLEMTVIQCVYASRYQDYRQVDSIPPEALKEPRYEVQQEMRAVFVPRKLPIKPVIVDVPLSARYCAITGSI